MPDTGILRALHEIDAGFDPDRTGRNDVDVFSDERTSAARQQLSAKHASKTRIKATRLIWARILRQDYRIHKIYRMNLVNLVKSCNPVTASIFRERETNLCDALQFSFWPLFVSSATQTPATRLLKRPHDSDQGHQGSHNNPPRRTWHPYVEAQERRRPLLRARLRHRRRSSLANGSVSSHRSRRTGRSSGLPDQTTSRWTRTNCIAPTALRRLAEAEFAQASPRSRAILGSLCSRCECLRCLARSEVDAAGVSDPAVQLSSLDSGRFIRRRQDILRSTFRHVAAGCHAPGSLSFAGRKTRGTCCPRFHRSTCWLSVKTRSQKLNRRRQSPNQSHLKHSQNWRTTRPSPPLLSIALDFTRTRSPPATIGS